MEKKLCKKCGKELSEDRKDKLCEECRNERKGLIRKILIGVGILGAVVAAVLFGGSDEIKQDYDIDDDDYEPIDNDEKATVRAGHSDDYRGHIPVGCRACGGPYPNCKDSCSLFDN